MRWIKSEGGPLILIPRSVLKHWRGVADAGDDYRAACAVTDYAGVIQRYGVDILVLNDEPLQTSCIARDGALLLVRWKYAPSESAIVAALEDVQQQLGSPCEETLLVCVERKHVLLDARSAGDRTTEHVEVETGIGPHRVETHLWKPNPDLGLIVHVLKTPDMDQERNT
jgi:hypothetical protein